MTSNPVHSLILVPQRYHRQPVISRLVSRYGLTVNIKAASLVWGSDSNGWFDLELSGSPEQLTNSLSYLQGLGVDLVDLAIANQIQPKAQKMTLLNSVEAKYQSHPQITHRNQKFTKIQWQEQFPQLISQGQSHRLRLQLCILKSYYQKPIISQLVSRYGLTVNITSALLQPDTEDDGWFELDLWGRTQQLSYSLSFLERLGIPIWTN
ncbi:NIL domain-containing protein [Fortiea contorta]|uniref:NIL domain-containing protein n=1 Tax=Fortiea contorta TaxID=1892405 RepID=UPI000344D7B4|nr:NIL domain-containing protein [Fortiea contorta]